MDFDKALKESLGLCDIQLKEFQVNVIKSYTSGKDVYCCVPTVYRAFFGVSMETLATNILV